MRQRTRTSRGESRRAGRASGPRQGRASGPGRGSVEARVEAAVASARHGAPPSPLLVDALARDPTAPAPGAASHDAPGSPDPVDRVLSGALVAAVADAWQRGWQPADLHRSAERALGRAGAKLLVRAVAAEVRRHAAGTVPPRWRQQLDAIGADAASPAGAGRPWAVPWPGPASGSGDPGVARVQAVGAAVATLAHVRGLPRLPKLGPTPGERRADEGPRRRPDAGVLHKVTSLLAKAESTTFPDEADALTAKAQELMTRHAIDQAQLESGRGDEPVAGGRRVAVDDPYANARYLLLSAVAGANRCRAVWTKQWGFSTVFGDEGDLDAVDLLYTSLLVQATRAMVLEPVAVTGNGGRTRSFRHAFLVAFAGRIGERLARAADEATADAARAGTAVVPLFEARRAAADRALDDAFPETRAMRVSARNAEGWQAGVRAADRAQLGAERPVRGGDRGLGR